MTSKVDSPRSPTTVDRSGLNFLVDISYHSMSNLQVLISAAIGQALQPILGPIQTIELP